MRVLFVLLLGTLLSSACSSKTGSPVRETLGSVSQPELGEIIDPAPPGGWWYYYNKTGDEVMSLLSANNARPTSVQVESLSPTRFTVAMVSNTGRDQRAWWFYYDYKGPDLATKAKSLNARIAGLSPYVVNGTLNFAAILLDNTGADSTGWWWYYDTQLSNIKNLLSQHNGQLIDWRHYQYTSGGTTYYAIVMVDNAGPLGTAWWWYPNTPESQIEGLLHTNDAYLVSINAADAPGTGVNTSSEPSHFDIIMNHVPSGPFYDWFAVNINPCRLTAATKGEARILDIKTEFVNGQRMFHIAQVNNRNVLVDDPTAECYPPHPPIIKRPFNGSADNSSNPRFYFVDPGQGTSFHADRFTYTLTGPDGVIGPQGNDLATEEVGAAPPWPTPWITKPSQLSAAPTPQSQAAGFPWGTTWPLPNGKYQVQVWASNSLGDSDTTTTTFTVGPACRTQGTPVAGAQCCSGLEPNQAGVCEPADFANCGQTAYNSAVPCCRNKAPCSGNSQLPGTCVTDSTGFAYCNPNLASSGGTAPMTTMQTGGGTCPAVGCLANCQDETVNLSPTGCVYLGQFCSDVQATAAADALYHPGETGCHTCCGETECSVDYYCQNAFVCAEAGFPCSGNAQCCSGNCSDPNGGSDFLCQP